MRELNFLSDTAAVQNWVGAMRQRPTRVLALANQKGGVGKTTTAINLGAALAELHIPTLLIDLDPQGNAATGLGVATDDAPTSYDIIVKGVSVQAACRATSLPDLQLVPSSTALLSVDLDLAQDTQRLYRLQQALTPWLAQHQPHGYVLLDCPPALTLLTLNAMVAAQSVLVPLQSEFFALEGLSQLLNTIRQIQGGHNTALRLEGVLLTMYDHRNNLSRQVEDDVRRHLDTAVLDTIVPRNVRVSEAPSHGKPAMLYDRQCAGSLAYMNLAREILKRDAQNMASEAAS